MTNYSPGLIKPGDRPPKRLMPKSIEGPYLPTIKIWNKFWQEVKNDYELNPKIKLLGSIDDLLLESPDGTCSECGKDLIRYELGSNRYFIIGIIYCPEALKSNTKEIKAWLEVWPHGRLLLDNSVTNNGVNLENARFILSNPKIRSCYNEMHILLQNIGESNMKEFDETYIIRPPEPSFRHDVHKSKSYEQGEGI